MDSFLEQLSKSVEQTILSALSAKLKDFAAHVVELPEMKEKNVTKEQILEAWNSVSEFKVVTSAQNAASAQSAASAQKAVENGSEVVDENSEGDSDKKLRSKTDKNKKCQVPKTRGDKKGEPCGKNCVVDTNFCPEHLKKNYKSPSKEVKTSENVDSEADESKEVSKEVSADKVSDVCPHILESGKNKGSVCGKKTTKDGKWCTVHAKKH